MEEPSLFRKSSMDRIQSPEQLNDYLHVTTPSVWVLLAAVIVLVAGALIWGCFTSIDRFADGTAQVLDGVMTVRFADPGLAKNVEEGMPITVGDSTATVRSVGQDEEGTVFALADTSLTDGTYQARVNYKQTQIIKLLFN